REIAHIGAILIHHRQTLNAALSRAALIDEYHAAIEVTFFTGQTLIDLVGNDVRHATPGFRRGEILLAGELLRGRDVPQPKLCLEAAVALSRRAAGDQRLRIDLAPARKLRRHIDIADALDISRLIDRGEQTAALEIVGDHLRDAGAD